MRAGTGQRGTQESARSLQKARPTPVLKFDVHFWPGKEKGRVPFATLATLFDVLDNKRRHDSRAGLVGQPNMEILVWRVIDQPVKLRRNGSLAGTVLIVSRPDTHSDDTNPDPAPFPPFYETRSPRFANVSINSSCKSQVFG